MARSKAPPPLSIRYRALAVSPLGRILARLAVVSALLLVGGLVMRQARAQAYKVPELRLDARSFAFDGLPPWADARIQAMLKHTALLPLDVSVFDPAAEQQVRAVLARHPLVRRVESVRILYPRAVRVRVVLREPGAWAETAYKGKGGKPFHVLLATDGHRIDERCYAGYLAQRSPLPVIAGIDRMALPVAGVPWDNLKEQVAEGLEAARVADRLARSLRWGKTPYVARIDVSRFPSPGNRLAGEVLLILNDATVVDWGRTERDLQGSVEEDVYERKMLRLQDALGGPARKRIDVRFPADPVLPQ